MCVRIKFTVLDYCIAILIHTVREPRFTLRFASMWQRSSIPAKEVLGSRVVS